MAYSPEQDEGHILVMGPSGTGKTSALLIPTLRSWQGTALVVDISGDISANVHTETKLFLTLRRRIVFRMMCLRPLMRPRMTPSVRSVWSSWPICCCRTRPTTARRAYFFTKNGRKMITAALICYYGMGGGFIEICEFFLGHDWRSLLNDIAKQENTAANAYISSFAGASEQNTAGCKQSADDALKLFATNSKIKNALRKVPTYEKSICPATLEQNSIYIFHPGRKAQNLWRPAAHYYGAVDGILFIQTAGTQADDSIFVLTNLPRSASCKSPRPCANCESATSVLWC